MANPFKDYIIPGTEPEEPAPAPAPVKFNFLQGSGLSMPGAAPVSAPQDDGRTLPPDQKAAFFQALQQRFAPRQAAPSAPSSGATPMTSSKAYEQYRKGFDEQANLLGKESQARQDEAEELNKKRDAQLEQAEKQQFELQAKQEAAAAARQAALDAHAKDVEALNSEQIDPMRLVNDKGVLGKIGFVLGSALGGLSQAINGHNTFQQTLMPMIDRDTKAQEAAQAMKRVQLAEKKGLIDDRYQADLNLISETAKRKALILQYAEKKLDNLAAMQGAKANARALELTKAQIVQERDKSLADYLSAQERANAAAAGARANRQWEAYKFDREMALKEGQVRAEQGKNINAETKDISQALVHEKLPQLKENIRLLEETMPNAEGVISSKVPDAVLRMFGGDATLARRQILNSVTQDMGHLKSGAALSAAEWASVERGLGVGASVQEQKNAIQLLKRAYSATENAVLKGYSPQAVETYRARTPGASAVNLDIRPGVK